MKKYIIYILLALCSFSLQAATADNSDTIKFELLKRLSRLQPNDTERLEVYYKIIVTSKNSDVEFYYINKLLKEADRLNNNEYKCKAYLRLMTHAYNLYDAEQVNKWMRLLEPIATRDKLYDFWFQGRRCTIDMLILNGEYEREEKEAQKMLQDAKKLNNNLGILLAYQCLSNVYRVTYRVKEANNILQEAYHIACKIDPGYALELNNSIIETYESLDDMDNLIKWTRIMDSYLQELIKKDPKQEADQQGWLMIVAAFYIKYYTYLEDFPKAAQQVQKMDKYNMEGYSTFSNIYHTALYRYYKKSEQYEKALTETEKIADIYKELWPLNYSNIIVWKADILQKMKRYDEALLTHRQALNISDSINIVLLNKQTDQLKKDYDTEQLLLEKEHINRNLQITYLSLIIIAIIILIVFVIHTFIVRRGLKRSEKEMRKMAEEIELANVAKENFLSTISGAISIPLNEVVKGSLQLANDEVTDESERREISSNLNKTSADLMKLINNILNLSRLEAGMMKFKKENIEILPYVQGIVTSATSDGKKINATFPKLSESPHVYADISWLQEVFNHLFSASQKTVTLTMQIVESRKIISIEVIDSILSDYPQQPRDIAMANEINRLAILNFGGTYKLDAENHVIIITLPIAKGIRQL